MKSSYFIKEKSYKLTIALCIFIFQKLVQEPHNFLSIHVFFVWAAPAPKVQKHVAHAPQP